MKIIDYWNKNTYLSPLSWKLALNTILPNEFTEFKHSISFERIDDV